MLQSIIRITRGPLLNFEPLIHALHSSSDGGRWKAAEALRQRGEPGGQLSAEALIHVLLHDTTPLHQAAADILRAWRDYAPVEPLFLAMQDADGQVRSAAKWALVEVGEYAQQESLLPHLADADTTVRAAVLSALGTRAPVAAVLEAVRAPEEGLREPVPGGVGVDGREVRIPGPHHQIDQGQLEDGHHLVFAVVQFVHAGFLPTTLHAHQACYEREALTIG
jgi:hypothetical protein